MQRIIKAVNDIPIDRKCVKELEIPCFVSHIVNTSDNPYGIFSVLENPEDSKEWSSHFKKKHVSFHKSNVLNLIYDNGIRHLDEEGNPTEDKDIPDSLYIIIDTVSSREQEDYYVITKKNLLRGTNYFYILESDIYTDFEHRNILETRITGYQIESFKKVVLCEDLEYEVFSNIVYLDVM